MNTASPTEFLQALLKGDVPMAIQVLVIFVLAHYGAFVAAYLAKLVKEGINWLKGKVAEVTWLQATTLDERFFDLLNKAVSNQVNLNVALAEVVADGKLTAEDAKRIVDGVWADFKANLGVTDWKSFALLLLGNESAPGAEKALRAKFDANVHALLANHAHTVAAKKLDRSLQTANLRSMMACSVPKA